MSSLSLLRASRAVRAARPAQPSRFASTGPSSSSSNASPALEKAQAAFGGVVDSGAKVLKSASETAGNALGAYKEPILGNAAVARELLKQVYIAEKLSPPSLATVTQTYSSFFHSAKDQSFWRKLIESGEWKRYGLYAIEAYGIFKIGEMIGRRHMVGYKLNERRPVVA